MKSIKSTIVLIFFLIAQRIDAQTYVGISGNLGNSLSYSPQSEGLKSPPSISGRVLLTKQESISENWVLQYGFGLGILGYKLKVYEMDTISAGGPTVYPEYSTFQGNFNLLAGRLINLKSKDLLIGLGGGVSYFYTFPSSWDYSPGIIFPDGSIFYVFSAEFNTPASKFLPYIKITTQLKLNFRFSIGLEYTHHFNSMLEGTYEFYHTSTPLSGNISLNPKEISLTLLMKISKF